MTAVNKRVLKDIKDGKETLAKESGIHIAPENNMYNVHFVIPGPPDTPYFGGIYHGMIRLNQNHPKVAPSIFMMTPSGRFEVEKYPISNSKRGICTTTSHFHPEMWTPVNNIITIINGFVSLMCDPDDQGLGGLRESDEDKKRMAAESVNILLNSNIFKELFPDLYQVIASGKYDANHPYGKETVKSTIDKPVTSKKPVISKKSVISKKPVEIMESESDSELSEIDLLELSDSSGSKNKKHKPHNKKSSRKKISAKTPYNSESSYDSDSSDKPKRKKKSAKSSKSSKRDISEQSSSSDTSPVIRKKKPKTKKTKDKTSKKTKSKTSDRKSRKKSKKE